MFKNANLALYNRDQIQDIKIHLQSLLHSQIIVKFKIFAILIANDLMIKFIISTIQFTNLLSSIYQQRQLQFYTTECTNMVGGNYVSDQYLYFQEPME